MISERVLNLLDVAFIPRSGDNAAIAKCLLRPSTTLVLNTIEIYLRYPVLEGHRFALVLIWDGDALLSWGLPFGKATRDIAAGDPLMNENMHKALSGRVSVLSDSQSLEKVVDEGGEVTPVVLARAVRDVVHSVRVNFDDLDVSANKPFEITEVGGFVSNADRRRHLSKPLGGELQDETSFFLGYDRHDERRGHGTRNHTLLLALTSAAAPQVRRMSHSVQQRVPADDCFDGIRCVAHTEGEASEQNNLSLILRCLCGFITHCNIGGVVALYTGQELHVTPKTVLEFAEVHRYPSQCFMEPHLQFVCIDEAENENVDDSIWRALYKSVECSRRCRRTRCPKKGIYIALQCGGSDAFSGMTGNCLAGDVAERLLLECGSSANLAESPELIGAEPYILENVANSGVAEKFIRTTEHYKAFAQRHGQTAQGNPSGGNLFRGLYNISLKSLGAARKKPPTTALDDVISYAEPLWSLGEGGGKYVFMDSPGNDLESIAGQVASGCNIIFFITGNGAMTNFPFVPTIKIVTTTSRFQLLEQDMDVDAGPYGEGGLIREEVIATTMRLTTNIINGERSKGEKANHSQVCLWRNWMVKERIEYDDDEKVPPPTTLESALLSAPFHTIVGKGMIQSTMEPLQVRSDVVPWKTTLTSSETLPLPQRRPMRRPIASIIPTSICSSEIARMIAESYNTENFLGCRWIAPCHTEGCGQAGDPLFEGMYQRMILAHALHRSVGIAVFLEHGCEKTHNDYFQAVLKEAGVVLIDASTSTSIMKKDEVGHGGNNLDRTFGFFSIQKDGGIDSVKSKIMRWLLDHSATCIQQSFVARPLHRWTVGIMVHKSVVNLATKRIRNSSTTVQVAKGDDPFALIPFSETMSLVVRYLITSLGCNVVVTNLCPLLSTGGNSVQQKNNINTVRFSTKKETSEIDLPLSSSACQFSAAVLTDAVITHATMLAGQSSSSSTCDNDKDIHNRNSLGLHLMVVPSNAVWDEEISCLSPACDALLLVADTAARLKLLPGSLLVPCLRRFVKGMEAQEEVDWGEETGREVRRFLMENVVSGVCGDTYFINGTFTVPRGSAVSM